MRFLKFWYIFQKMSYSVRFTFSAHFHALNATVALETQKNIIQTDVNTVVQSKQKSSLIKNYYKELFFTDIFRELYL